MAHYKNKPQHLDEIEERELHEGGEAQEWKISNSPLYQMGKILLITDYHCDFYDLARDSRIFGYNIECEILYVDLERCQWERLDWIDIYTGRERDYRVSDDSRQTTAAQGFEGAHHPESNESVITIPAEGDVPEILFDGNICYPQTDRIFFKTVKQCACAWAKIHDIEVPLENVIVIHCERQEIVDALQNPKDYGTAINRCLQLIQSELPTYNPDLALRWGIVTEDIYRRLADEVEQESARRIPIKSIAPLTPNQTSSLESTAGAETVSEIQTFIEWFNAGQTSAYPLHIKVAQGKGEEVKAMLDAGADANARDTHSLTPLHAAAQSGRVNMIQLLLHYGADVNLRTRPEKGNQRPLDDAIDQRQIEAVRALIEGGTDVNAPIDEHGSTALFSAIRSQQPEIAAILIQAGAKVDQKVDRDFEVQPLHEAAATGTTEIIQMLLAAGADINARMKDGATALGWAVECGQEAALRMLLAHGGDPDLASDDGRTPLIRACWDGKLNLIQILLEAGADRNARFGDEKWTALDVARKRLSEEVYRQVQELFDTIPEPGSPE